VSCLCVGLGGSDFGTYEEWHGPLRNLVESLSRMPFGLVMVKKSKSRFLSDQKVLSSDKRNFVLGHAMGSGSRFRCSDL